MARARLFEPTTLAGLASLVADAHAPSHGPERSTRANERLLFLHGEGASAMLQRGWLQRTGWLACLSEAHVETVLIDAPHGCGAKPKLVPAHARAEYEAAGRYHSWGSSSNREALDMSMRCVDWPIISLPPLHCPVP